MTCLLKRLKLRVERRKGERTVGTYNLNRVMDRTLPFFINSHTQVRLAESRIVTITLFFRQHHSSSANKVPKKEGLIGNEREYGCAQERDR